MPLFGLSFVVVGIGLLSIPYFSRNQALNTVYALTDRCAIRITDGKPCRLVEYKESDFGPIEVTRYKNNRADVLFIKDSSEGDKHPYGGFYGISNADIAIAILRKHCHQPDNFQPQTFRHASNSEGSSLYLAKFPSCNARISSSATSKKRPCSSA
jgi:hypothetical protein